MIIKSKLDPLDYDDVLLVPEHSYIKSRKDVNIFVTDKKYMPIFSAPMKGISSVPFIKELSKLGGIGILHRFFSTEAERLESIIQLKETKNYGIAIGINQWKKELTYVKLAIGNGAKFICIDTATGHMQRTIDSVYLLNAVGGLAAPLMPPKPMTPAIIATTRKSNAHAIILSSLR